jgi:hypothetical protein
MKKRFSTKLRLSKETLVNLNETKMQLVAGGIRSAYAESDCSDCFDCPFSHVVGCGNCSTKQG